LKSVKRQHIHFPGFEPLTSAQHYRRFLKGSENAGKVWGSDFQISEFDEDKDSFSITAKGKDWNAETNILVVEFGEQIQAYMQKSLIIRLLKGYLAFFDTLFNGGLFGYFKHAWRFGLFAILPFLLISIGLSGIYHFTQLLSFGEPLNMLWSLPLSIAVFVYFYLPLCNRLHTVSLFANWVFTIALVRLNDPKINAWLETMQDAVKQHIDQDCDEILITTHSMGGSTGVHIIGALLEKYPDLFEGKTVVFSQLGGCVLQCALPRPAQTLRRRVGLIARNPSVEWLEVQCITDAVIFYKTDPVAIFGFTNPDKPTHKSFLRFKHQLKTPNYKRIKKDLLQLHRQYVLSADKLYKFDFIPFVAGPYISTERLQRLIDKKPALD
jgi:hypothetical protein